MNIEKKNTSKGHLVRNTNTQIKENNLEISPTQAIEINQIIKKIYCKYNNKLTRFLWGRLDSKNDVEDVSQDVYLRLIRHPKFNELGPSLTLLYTIASNLLKDRFRKQKVRRIDSHVSFDDMKIKSLLASPEQVVEKKERMDAIHKAFSKLNKKRRLALTLYRLKEFTYDQIAEEMGISKTMVRKHITKAMLQISLEIEKQNEKNI